MPIFYNDCKPQRRGLFLRGPDLTCSSSFTLITCGFSKLKLDLPDDFWGVFTLNYHMVNNFVPLCLSLAVIFLGEVPAWLLYLGISFVMQLFYRWWWRWTSKVARSPVRQFDMSQLNSVGLNIPVPTAVAYNEPSAPPIAKVDDSTHTVTMTQAEKEMFEMMKRLQARDQTVGRVV